MIWGFLIFTLTLAGKLLFDRHLHFSRKTIKHKGEAVIVCICLVVASWFASDYRIRPAGVYFVGFLNVFWAIFDPSFGLIIASNPCFLGTTARLDRLQHRYKWIIWAKYIGAVVFTLLFLLRNKMQYIP